MTLTNELMKILQEEREEAARQWAEAELADTRVSFGPGDYVPVGHPALEPALSLPDSNPKTAFGMQKPSFHCIPPAALIYLGAVMKNGAEKYGLMNWRQHAVTFSVYYNAILRHLFAVLDGEWIDPESKQPHLAHVMACATVILDANENGKLNDDRPGCVGQAPKMVRPN